MNPLAGHRRSPRGGSDGQGPPPPNRAWGRSESAPEPGFARQKAQARRGNVRAAERAAGSADTRTTAAARKEGERGGTSGSPTFDCDLHVAPASIETLGPFLGDYWNEYVATAGIRLQGLPTAYPPKAPTTGGTAPAGYEVLRERVLDVFQPDVAILNCLTICEAHRNPHYQAALASALNDWLRAEFLDRDERLRASVVVSTVDPDDAATEIERLDDPRFVQVLLPVRADAPYGNKRYQRLHAVAAERGLVLGLHAWGRVGQSATTTGYTLSYVEDYLANPIIVQQHVLSLVSEGVFERFPDLRVSVAECGFTWLPSLLWRFDKDWKGIWREVPWVKELPSTYVRRHFRATIAPAHLPAERRHTEEVLASVGPELLLHASDYPHDHGGAEALYDALDADAAEAVHSRNAAALYRLD